jgi:tetratricopeptide (TPR) repeat protein
MSRIRHVAAIAAMLLFLFGPVGAHAQGQAQVDDLNTQVGQLYAQGNYAGAIAVAKQSLALAERALGPDHSSTITSVNNLALLYYTQGRYSEAEPLYRRACEGYERQLGPSHAYTLTCLNNLAELFRAEGQHAAAEPVYKRVLSVAERALGKENPVTLQSLVSLAVLYGSEGRYGRPNRFSSASSRVTPAFSAKKILIPSKASTIWQRSTMPWAAMARLSRFISSQWRRMSGRLAKIMRTRLRR